MDSSQIALIGGLVIAGISAAGGLMAPLVTLINARSDRHAQKTELWLAILKERGQRLIELLIQLETLPDADDTRLDMIFVEIYGLVISTGHDTTIKLWDESIDTGIDDLIKRGTTTYRDFVKLCCAEALIKLGMALNVWLEVDDERKPPAILIAASMGAGAALMLIVIVAVG